MTNSELAMKREQLSLKADRIAALNPLVAAGEMKTAALLVAEITGELARRELNRGHHGE